MKVACFIGRFQPFHNGHAHVINETLKLVDKIIVIIGSANEPRTARNPFTTKERELMIRNYYNNSSVIIDASVNRYYNDHLWSNDIRSIVAKYTSEADEIFLTGHAKDHTSYYLNMFPEWESINIKPYVFRVGDSKFKLLNATQIREKIYTRYYADWSWHDNLPSTTIDVINNISLTDLDHVIDEYKFIQSYKKQWEVAPYPVTFNTVDAVVVQSGHVLMVTRGAQPGKGLLALPGGFINQYETIEDAAIRELKEETCIDMPQRALKGRITKSHVFDSPYRSQRGRTITHAFYFELDSAMKLPKIKGADDAANAFWIPLNVLNRSYIFEDHADIIEFFTSVKID